MDGELLTNAIGTAAALLSITSFIWQIRKIMQTRDASSVSLKTYAFTVTSFTLWVIYGVRIESWPIIGANTAALLVAAGVLGLKWRYRDQQAGQPAD